MTYIPYTWYLPISNDVNLNLEEGGRWREGGNRGLPDARQRAIDTRYDKFTTYINSSRGRNGNQYYTYCGPNKQNSRKMSTAVRDSKPCPAVDAKAKELLPILYNSDTNRTSVEFDATTVA